MRIFVLDNYDSFTFNLVQALRVHGAEVDVARNDELSVDEVLARKPTHLVISPGPGRPEDAGISVELVHRALAERLPLLGVCLGHQSMVAALGGKIVAARHLMHGKHSDISHDGRGLFEGLPNPLRVGRYHSLAAATPLPPGLEITARTEDGDVMAVRHTRHPAWGVQFHPESILTPDGDRLLGNFVALSRHQVD